MQISYIKRVLLFLSFITLFLYLLSCLTAFISPVHGYFFTFAGLFFPIGIFIMFGICLLSIFFFRKYFLFFSISLLAGYPNIVNIIGFHKQTTFNQAKSKNHIRILSWNVNDFLEGKNYDPDKVNAMLDFIKKSDADIICFQDYSASKTSKADASTEKIKEITGLPYSYFSEADYNYGVIILSKWPFLKQRSIPFKNVHSTESLQFVDIKTDSKILRIYNTHLSSMNIHVNKMDDAKIQQLKIFKYDETVLLKKDKMRRIAYFDKVHVKEAEIIKNALDSCSYPFVFTADLNAVPSSYVYHYIRKGLKDAFLEKGWGFGRTYDSLSPTLRIDVILTNQHTQTIQYYCPHLHLSDHYPIIADFEPSSYFN